jgi:hypothetical protein
MTAELPHAQHEWHMTRLTTQTRMATLADGLSRSHLSMETNYLVTIQMQGTAQEGPLSGSTTEGWFFRALRWRRHQWDKTSGSHCLRYRRGGWPTHNGSGPNSQERMVARARMRRKPEWRQCGKKRVVGEKPPRPKKCVIILNLLPAINLVFTVQRGAQLGEPTLPQPKRSVFDYLSQKDRDRLLNFRTAAGAPNAPDTSQPAPPKPTVKPRIAPTTAPTAKAALLGFQPFAADPLRHARYTAYLQYHASAPSVSDTPPASLGLLPHQNAEQFNKEMEDYAKAAAIFKPVTGAMAGRFVGGTSTIIGATPIVEGGLYQPTYEKKVEGKKNICTWPPTNTNN